MQSIANGNYDRSETFDDRTPWLADLELLGVKGRRHERSRLGVEQMAGRGVSGVRSANKKRSQLTRLS